MNSSMRCGIAVLLLGAATAPAVEPWADPGLKVTEGLELWLDASKQDGAMWAMQGAPLIPDRTPLGVWYDGSGHRRHVLQRMKTSQPEFRRVGLYAAGRFDGVDDFLSLHTTVAGRREWTVFVLASPRSNAGGYGAMMSMAKGGRNDFQSGLTIDLGPEPGEKFQTLNVEGAGFSGATDLMDGSLEWDRFHTVAVRISANVSLHIDGQAAGRRKRGAPLVHMEELAIGARLYNHTGPTPFAQGFFHGDIAEVLVYGRALSDAEMAQVESYLAGKRDAMRRAVAETGQGRLLRPLADAPQVQVLAPGFTVREMPVDLTHINNVKYRRDGKLFALAYNGNVWLLSDSDGDGLEDRAELFWKNDGSIVAPIGMDLTPPGYARGSGVIFASKHEVALVVDTDGDDRADQKITVARGWKPTIHQVDALGVAFDREGAIYFGLGTEWFAEPYLLDKETGRARYDVKGERGTIQKVSADFSTRQTIATGLRFSVGMAINRHGDLFVTDQEGATWVPNGNPLDELLHIQPGRHYGFPARHPRHLPEVIDEPSTFDYGPQHQSACGVHFNDGVNGGPVFGPEWWRGDALVCGESRGKIYRTKLVRTDAGYVGQNQVIACLGMLTVDACPTPDGNLVVACHSGAPDWGTGPDGKGKLYKIIYTDRQAPQPVLAWPAGEREVRIAFDRPLSTELLSALSGKVTIEYGHDVRAGDRFETMWPGYAVVERQRNTPRFDLAVHSVSVTPDRRTLILATDPHPRAAHYAISIAWPRRGPAAGGDIPQHNSIELDYTLNGVEASGSDEPGQAQWTGWLPHVDLEVSRQLTRGSADHDRLWSMFRRTGQLRIHTLLDVDNLLRPAVQPGSSIDFEYPHEEPRVTIEPAPGGGAAEPGPVEGRAKLWRLERVIGIPAGNAERHFRVTYHTNEDSRPRPFPLHRLLLPWAPLDGGEPHAAIARSIPQLQGGDWLRGRDVFFSDEAMCGRCHGAGGRGGRIGPDLSNLIYRDYASVLRDIEQPSAAINPDHIAYQITLTDGRTLLGVPRTLEDGRIAVGDMAGVESIVSRDAIRSMDALPVSGMPPALNVVLGPEKLRDLMTFLLTAPLEPAKIEAPHPPPPRKRAEVEPLIPASRSAPTGAMRIVLVAGDKDHGPGEHDYPLWKERWSRLLAMADKVTVQTADTFPTAGQLAEADVVAFYQRGDWNADRAAAIDAYLARGGGLVYLHWAVDGREGHEEFARRIGLAARGGRIKFRHGPLEVTFGGDHPITRGFGSVSFHDESYWNLTGDPASVQVLGSAVEEGQPRPLIWTRQVGPGRIFVSIPGHYTWTFDDPLYRILVLRGLCWAAGQPVDRLSELATIGARME